MTSFYSVFVRTIEPASKFKSFLEQVLNSPLEKYPNSNDESFHTSMLGIEIHLEEKDNDKNYILVLYGEDEILSLSTYDLEIRINYNRHTFMRNYAEEWKQSVSVKIADALTLAHHCESIVVKNYETVIDRFMPFEERTIPRHTDE